MDIVVNNTTGKAASIKRVRRTREDWSALVKTWESSNQTQQAFCKEHALCYRQFCQWKSRLKKEMLADADASTAPFVPIQLKASTTPQSTGSITVRLPNGFSVDVAHDSDVDFVARLTGSLAVIAC